MNNKVFVIGGIDDYYNLFDSIVGIEEYMNAFVFCNKCEYEIRRDLNSELNIILKDELSLLDRGEKYVYMQESYKESVEELFKEKYAYKASLHFISFESWFSEIVQNKNIWLQPTHIGIDASTYCNLNCTGCYMRKNSYDGVGAGFLNIKDLEVFLNNYPSVKTIELANNGEAVLNPEIDLILEFLNSKNIRSSFSGGLNFNSISKSSLNRMVTCGVDHITIAIDGVEQSIYEKYRRNGNVTQVINNIIELNKIKQAYKSKTPKLTWQYVLMEDNECDIEKAKILAKSLNMDIIFKLSWDDNYMPHDENFVRKTTGLTILNRNDRNYNWLLRCREMLFLPKINWDGRLLGCCSSHSMDFGFNVFEIPLDFAINSQLYKNTVRAVFNREKPSVNTPCGNCWIYKKHIHKER